MMKLTAEEIQLELTELSSKINELMNEFEDKTGESPEVTTEVVKFGVGTDLGHCQVTERRVKLTVKKEWSA